MSAIDDASYVELIGRARNPRRPTLAETRTGLDWCPNCKEEVGCDRYWPETGTRAKCGVCAAELVAIP